MPEPIRNIGQIISPLARVAAWVLLREELRHRKEADEVWPWTVCRLLSCGNKFCNVHREDDATSRWCAAHVRAPFAGTPELLPAVVLFVLFNLVETGATLFTALDGEASPFASALQTGSVAPLRQALTRQPLPHTNNAYQIFGLSKAEMPITDQLLVQWKLWLDGSDWRWRYERWSDSPPPLARVHAWFRTMYRGSPYPPRSRGFFRPYPPPNAGKALSRAWGSPRDGSGRQLALPSRVPRARSSSMKCLQPS